MGYMKVMQISRSRALEEPNGIKRNSEEGVVKVTRWTSFAKECNFSLHI
jgi:hypothetical protein